MSLKDYKKVVPSSRLSRRRLCKGAHELSYHISYSITNRFWTLGRYGVNKEMKKLAYGPFIGVGLRHSTDFDLSI